jgi:hypothetical protein
VKFDSQEEKIYWLKKCGSKIYQLEGERNSCIMRKDFGRAYSLLLAIKFAKTEFRKVSLTLKKYDRKK